MTLVNPDTIKTALTLRYSQSFKSDLPKLSWKNFNQNMFDNNLSSIENLIQSGFKNAENKLKNKPVISLSAGIDSTLILTLLRKYYPELSVESISISFSDSVDESSQAKKIADKLDVNHNILHIDNFFENLPQAISIIKEPFWDLHWFEVAKKANSLGNILISGDGGDELFGGYTFRYQKFLSIISNKSTISEKINCYLSCHERDWVLDQEDLFGNKINFSWDYIHSILKPYFDNSLSPIDQVFLADYNGKLLFNMSPIYKIFHQHFGIDYFAPLLSSDLIDFAGTIPSNLKYDKETNIGKKPLRKILTDNNMLELTIRKKQGFSVNTQNLWKSSAKSICHHFLDDARITKDGWINKDWIKKYIDKPELEPRIINKFFGILAFEIWYRLFITKDMNANEKLIF
ncbi:asparagine synthase C-terminal domain-containing protein [Candidatus Nitrosopelagicus sp.]|nr:asparagine synthase C-terminal domain-containing protein [Candidatus Nitrosopelagicus sp.]|tara:strand:+ start:2308 stop:3516 length:1209 start_codon:yes stop_codon:yes gene_type:complete